jgi:flagellar basal-body rod modification protein FlgD
MPSSINSVTSGASSPLDGWQAPKVTASNGSQMDRDTFLKLLVAQVKNQNPAEPMNPNEMMSQMSQLTMVDKLNQLVEAQTSADAFGRLALAATLVNHQVEWQNIDGTVGSGTVSQARLDGEKLMLTVGNSEIDASTVTKLS